MFLVAAATLLAIFSVNVALGAAWNSPFLSDVGEMVVLFAASVAFTAAILRREAQTAKKK